MNEKNMPYSCHIHECSQMCESHGQNMRVGSTAGRERDEQTHWHTQEEEKPLPADDQTRRLSFYFIVEEAATGNTSPGPFNWRCYFITLLHPATFWFYGAFHSVNCLLGLITLHNPQKISLHVASHISSATKSASLQIWLQKELLWLQLLIVSSTSFLPTITRVTAAFRAVL